MDEKQGKLVVFGSYLRVLLGIPDRWKGSLQI